MCFQSFLALGQGFQSKTGFKVHRGIWGYPAPTVTSIWFAAAQFSANLGGFPILPKKGGKSNSTHCAKPKQFHHNFRWGRKEAASPFSKQCCWCRMNVSFFVPGSLPTFSHVSFSGKHGAAWVVPVAPSPPFLPQPVVKLLADPRPFFLKIKNRHHNKVLTCGVGLMKNGI